MRATFAVPLWMQVDLPPPCASSQFQVSGCDEKAKQVKTRRGNAVALRILKECIFGNVRELQEVIDSASNPPDEAGIQLFRSLSDTGGWSFIEEFDGAAGAACGAAAVDDNNTLQLERDGSFLTYCGGGKSG